MAITAAQSGGWVTVIHHTLVAFTLLFTLFIISRLLVRAFRRISR